MRTKPNSESVVREIRRKSRKKYSTEEKIRVVLQGIRGEDSIAALCRREAIHPNLYYRWSRDFLEAGKKRLQGDTMREANSSEVGDLRKENEQLKQLIAELALKNRVLKKSLSGMDSGSDDI
jgi:transposase